MTTLIRFKQENVYLEEPFVSKDEVQRSLCADEIKVPLLVGVPEDRVLHVYLELQRLHLQELPVGQRGRRLHHHERPSHVGAVALTADHPRNLNKQ